MSVDLDTKELPPVAFGGFDERVTAPGDPGDTYIHPVRVIVNAGGKATVIDSGGTHMAKCVPHRRGVITTLEFVSENGAHFAMDIAFAKGMTYVTTREFANLATHADDGLSMAMPTPTIWRD